jgi:hypothetical protein
MQYKCTTQQEINILRKEGFQEKEKEEAKYGPEPKI